MLRIGERRLVMLTMLQMEGKLAKGDDPALNAQVCSSSPLRTINTYSVVLMIHTKRYRVNSAVQLSRPTE